MSADRAGLDQGHQGSAPAVSVQIRVSTEVLDQALSRADASAAALAEVLSYEKVTGRTSPRLWTRPLRPLTPETSYGFRAITWASDRGYALDPWERWAVVHAGELLPDGRPRFRRVLIIVARQNGKTLLLKVLILWWAYEDSQFMILMTSTNLDYAREALFDAAEMAGADPTMPKGLRRMIGIPAPELRQANGQERLTAPSRRINPDDRESRLVGGGTFRIAAASGKSGGRSLSIRRLVADELRQHTSWEAYNAGIHTMSAVRDAQAFFISNQGDQTAVVLHALRDEALEGADRRLGIFEWSAPKDSRADDVAALRYANPNLGHRNEHNIDPETLVAEARTAMRAGGDALAKFKIEVLCIDVPNLDPAIDLDAWRESGGDTDMSGLRNRVAACLDISPDGSHAMLLAAAVDAEGLVRVEVVKEWTSTRVLRRQLPNAVARVRPRKFGWLPNGPAAAIAADLAAPKQRRSSVWPPPGVDVQEIRTDVPAVCMGFADIVASRGVIHPVDPMLTDHVTNTRRLAVGSRWVFGSDGPPICGAYAAAGAVHLARMLPQAPRVRKLRTAK